MKPDIDTARLLLISTRPLADSQALAVALEGVRVVALPAAELTLRPLTPSLMAQLSQPAEWWVFPSRFAVNVLRYLLPEQRQAITAVCPGAGTARALREMHVKRVIMPTEDHTSEALLALAALQNVAGMRIRILAAPGGRQLIQETLAARGAKVQVVEVYDRGEPEIRPAQLSELSGHEGLMLSLVTSIQGLRYLHDRLPETLWQRVCNAWMLAPSMRVARAAHELGVEQTLIVNPPEHNAVVRTVRELLDEMKTGSPQYV